MIGACRCSASPAIHALLVQPWSRCHDGRRVARRACRHGLADEVAGIRRASLQAPSAGSRMRSIVSSVTMSVAWLSTTGPRFEPVVDRRQRRRRRVVEDVRDPGGLGRLKRPEPAPLGIGMPPVGMPRPVCRRSRMSRLVPAAQVLTGVGHDAGLLVMPTASLNVVIAVPMTMRPMVVAISSSDRVKPASEGCVRIVPFRLREVRDVRRQRVRPRLRAALVRDRDGDRPEVVSTVGDHDLAG